MIFVKVGDELILSGSSEIARLEGTYEGAVMGEMGVLDMLVKVLFSGVYLSLRGAPRESAGILNALP